MTDRNDALRALESRQWAEDEVTVVTAPSTAMVGIPARYRPEVYARVKADADARGVHESVILRELVDEAYAARDAADDEPVTLRPSDLARVARQIGRDRSAA